MRRWVSAWVTPAGKGAHSSSVSATAGGIAHAWVSHWGSDRHKPDSCLVTPSPPARCLPSYDAAITQLADPSQSLQTLPNGPINLKKAIEVCPPREYIKKYKGASPLPLENVPHSDDCQDTSFENSLTCPGFFVVNPISQNHHGQQRTSSKALIPQL